MNKTDKLKEKYIADAEGMASKSRFGYFSLLPSHTAAHTDFPHQPARKDSDGKVITQPRNIYSGNTSTPALQKNYFKYTPSAFHGSPYQDPNQVHKDAPQPQGKELFKPAKLNKSLMSSSYPYLSPYDPKTDQKQFRDSDGKVITKPPNVQTNPQSRINYLQNKEFKYVECPPRVKQTTQPSNNQKEPFRTGNSHLEVFNGHYNTYFDAELKKPDHKKEMVRSVSHEGPFKPSCTSKDKAFTPVVYVQEGSGKPKVEKIVKKQNKVEPFRLLKVEHNSKPCPSIALSKVNMLRICR